MSIELLFSFRQCECLINSRCLPYRIETKLLISRQQSKSIIFPIKVINFQIHWFSFPDRFFSLSVRIRIKLLELIKIEPDIKDDLDDSNDVVDTVVPVTASTTGCDEAVDNCSDSSEEKTRPTKRRRAASPSTSSETTAKKYKTDAHSSLLAKYFNMSCDLCDTLLLSFRDTNKHYKDVHDLDKGYLICCSKKFYRLQHMLQHCEWHINPDSFK